MPARAWRICWPDPDATCLEGGCVHCDGCPPRPVREILAYVRRVDTVPNRCGGGTRRAIDAFNYGMTYGRNADR